MAHEKLHTTNYFNTFIEVAEDTKAERGTIPVVRGKKTIAQMQYELVHNNPYKFTSDDVFFHVYAERHDIPRSEYAETRAKFYSTGRACFRSSPLTKTYGFGVHSDNAGRVALYGMETEEYSKFAADPNIKSVRAMRSSGK